MAIVNQLDKPWRLEFGARPVKSGGVEFRVWAPLAKELSVVIKSPREIVCPMNRDESGCFSEVVEGVGAGADYVYRITPGTNADQAESDTAGGIKERPDPVSRWQPGGVHGASRVLDPDDFPWSDSGWKGIATNDYIIYELHIGTFTPAGTFTSAIEKLTYLRDNGITAVEIMPVAQFPGARGWGYDGVFPYAVQSTYGGPVGLRRLVDACHRAGLAVIMDCVYNHFGPEGNYLPDYMPCFSDRYKSPWGQAINYDGPDSDGIRRYLIENALYWLAEYHIDALRLDAIHGIFDFGARHVLAELSDRFHQEARKAGRQALLIAESDLDDVRVITPSKDAGWGMDAQWNDAFHHSAYTVFTGETQGYFADYGRFADLSKAITQGFVYDWRYSKVRRRYHGSSSTEYPGWQFVIFTQNHDQVANAFAGRRPSEMLSLGMQKAQAALLLCAPNLPMLFMGQEFGALAQFTYFTDFADHALAKAVSEGRKKEYEGMLGAGFIDPQSEQAFESSKLDWERLTIPPHDAILKFHRDLIALRKLHNCLSNCRKDLTTVDFDETKRWMTIERRDELGERAMLVLNLSDGSNEIPIAHPDGLELALFGGEEETASMVKNPGHDRGSVTFNGAGAALYISRS